MPQTADPPLTMNARLRWDVVSRALPSDAVSVLEIGCGQGAFAARLARLYPDVTALEPDHTSWEVASARVATVGRGRVLQQEFSELDPNLRFDLICAFEVIEHIEDDLAALRTWASRLKPGGTLLLSTPGYQKLFSPFDEMVGHFRRYEPDALRLLLTEAGLIGAEVRHYGFPIGYALERLRRAAASLKSRRGRPVTENGGPTVTSEDVADRTAASGRLMQPDKPWKAAVFAVAVAPFLPLQRRFPDRGTTLVAWGRAPG